MYKDRRDVGKYVWMLILLLETPAMNPTATLCKTQQIITVIQAKSVTHPSGFDRGETYCIFRAIITFLFHDATVPSGPGPPHYRGFTITLRHSTLGRTHFDEWSTRHRALCLTTHNTHNRQTSMPPRESNPQSSVSLTAFSCICTTIYCVLALCHHLFSVNSGTIPVLIIYYILRRKFTLWNLS
jgi:hypothetical protein